MWEGGREGGTGSLDDAAGPGSGGLFGDVETRAFYEELPDLLTTVPLTILGFTPEQVHFSLDESNFRQISFV